MEIRHLYKLMMVLISFIISNFTLLKAESVVNVTEAGTLSSLLNTNEEKVKITGPLNGTDIKYLRHLINEEHLTSIDLTDAQIVSGGDYYLDSLATSNNVIGESMFYECKNLKEISLPNTIYEISQQAFSRSGLTEIEIPNGVSNLEFDAFAYCNSLSTVIIGKRVSNCSQGVFYSSPVKTVYVKTHGCPAVGPYLFSSNPTIYVYSDMLDDFKDSDWDQFGTLTGNLEEIYPVETNHLEWLKELFGKYFKDYACTELQENYQAMSDDELSTAMSNDELPDDVKEFILKIKNNSWAAYEKDFRIHSYNAYSDANYWNKLLKSTGGSYMGNPTGIYAEGTQPIYVFVDQEIPDDATLYIAGCTGNNLISNAKTGDKLNKGVNIIEGQPNALYYIVYTADTRSKTKKISEWPDIKIHIEGGIVNGYYDVKRHSDEAYVEILGNATHKLFTVKGGETLFNFNRTTYQMVWPTTIDKSIIWFDSLTVWEKELMGICESVATGQRAEAPFNLTGGESIFPIYYNNPNFAIEGIKSDDGYANSSNYRTSYNSDTCIMNSFDVSRSDHDDWCAAHECGHNNQSAINLEGCTEVSNNLFSNVICLLDGRTTTNGSPLSTTMYDYAHHTPYFVRDVTSMMRMYYQLYLYYHQGRRNTSFFPTLFKELREDPLSLWENTDNSSLKFVRKVCEVAQEDLTDFFTAWGFFEPCELTINDYGTYSLTVTQEDIDKTLEEISKYPKKNREILFVEDRVDYMLTTDFLTTAGQKRNNSEKVGTCGDLGQFTSYLPDSLKPAEYSYLQSDSLFAMSGTGGVGFIALNNEGKMVYASNSLHFCIPSCIKEEFTLYAVDADGTLHETTKQEGGSANIHLTQAGTLADSLSPQVLTATISGPMNGTDIAYLREMLSEGNLQVVDLSQAILENGTIGEEAFTELRQLTSIILPENLTRINDNAFSHTELNEVTIPNDVTYIGFDAFAYSEKLTNVIIGSSVEYIRQGAFYSTPVTNAYVKATTPPSIANYLFSSEPVIHVYASSLEAYQNSDWAKFGTIVGDLDDYDFSEPTELQQPLSDTTEMPKDSIIFDLFGRKVVNQRSSTIYIENGKKVIWMK
ncbi:MAG: leucine-rich repeat protein [Paludibacteraceae bacterium]|nr:leucine-rich repeat protein [Paludibacteraceae bacterium]